MDGDLPGRPKGIKQNGGIRVELPDSWHSGIRNSANRLQSSDPKGENYISSRCSRAGARVRVWVEDEPPAGAVLVKSPRRSLDGRYERYVYVVRVWVLEGKLSEGDTLSIVYGDTSGGSPGMRAGIIRTHPEPILLAVDSGGTGEFRIPPNRPTLQIHAGTPVELMLSGPSTLVAGRRAELMLAVVDAASNPTPFDTELEIRVTQGKADVPSRVHFRSEDGWQAVSFMPREPGMVRLVALSREGLQAVGNPMNVFEREPELKVYWGELHSHTTGLGTLLSDLRVAD